MEQMTQGKFSSLAGRWPKDGTDFVEVDKGGHMKIEGSIKAGNYSYWDSAKIKAAFNFGQGTMADFKRYIENNMKYLWMIELV